MCNPAFADVSCNVPITQITASGATRSLDVPGGAWRYFMVSVPYQGNANMLVELIKPPLSNAIYQPSLQLAARSSGLANTASYGIPGVSAINPSDFTLYVSHTSQEVVSSYAWILATDSNVDIVVAGQLHVQLLQLLHPLPSK